MRVIPYTLINIEKIAEAQGKSLEYVRDIQSTAVKLDPDHLYYAMADFEPWKDNLFQKIEYIREDILIQAFEPPPGQSFSATEWTNVTRIQKFWM